MIDYQIKSQNLNNSLVFYRALFDRMPTRLDFDSIVFKTDQFRLEIEEGLSLIHESMTMKVHDKKELKLIHRRMNRFRGIERLKSNCEVIESTIGLIDPDGHRWKIGDPMADVEFEKCYVIH